MAMEICELVGEYPVRTVVSYSFTAMHKAWPDLLNKMQANKVSTTPKERQLVISARTWFCLYIFEHQ